jgi:hypothetical protein
VVPGSPGGRLDASGAEVTVLEKAAGPRIGG